MEVFKSKDGSYYEITELRECEHHGRYIGEARLIMSEGFGDPFYLPGCPACRREREQQEAFGRLAIPRRFQGKTFDDFIPQNEVAEKVLSFFRNYAAHLPEMIERGTSIILFGGVGTGKSHLACSLVAEAHRQGRTAMFSSVFSIIQDIRSTWRESDDERRTSEREVIKRYSTLDLLVIDEIGVQSGSDNERNLLFSVLNGRYENVLPTILISNLTLAEIKATIGERAFDRLREGGGRAFSCDWPSYRSTASAAPKRMKNQQQIITVEKVTDLPGMEKWRDLIATEKPEVERRTGVQARPYLRTEGRGEKQVRTPCTEGRRLAEVVHAGIA